MKKHYTSKEQSKRLIGILHEGSADLCYVGDIKIPVAKLATHPLPYDELPCWSTGALLDMLSDRKDDPPLILERSGYSDGSYTHNWFLWVDSNKKNISDNDYDLVELLVRAIERIYKNDIKEE